MNPQTRGTSDVFKSKVTRETTLYLKHLYEIHKKIYGTRFELEEYRFILDSFFEKVLNEILNFRIYELPHNMGRMFITKADCEMRILEDGKMLIHSSHFLIDLKKTEEQKRKVYHTDVPYKYRFRWEKGKNLFNGRFYALKQSRKVGRLVYDKSIKDFKV